MIVKAQQNDNLDAIIYRYFGTSYGGILEQTLLLNPQLTANAILAIDTEVLLPDTTAPRKTTETLQLWT
ncbi:tail protein X [Basfia succiniciproducens]|uniref:tail protein X n=1 Tax=Basfia succiniciproducens TaxID=653940 RepID=UPI003FCDD8E9